MSNFDQVTLFMKIHEEVINSGQPYPTNVSTPIGQQSEEYKKAKRLANEKKAKKREERNKRK